jgi:uncharacterized protein (TIGR00369 family)
MIAERMAVAVATMADDLDDDPPPGFVPIDIRPDFHTMMGQIYGKMEKGALVCGFRCSPRHMNSNGGCHGGMIASFADFSAYELRLIPELAEVTTPTASLAVEYLRPVRLGDWVESRVQVTRQGRRLIFCRVTGTVKDEIVFTATGLFVAGAPDPGGHAVLAQVMATP